MSFQYREAGRVLTAVSNRKGSLKTLIFNGQKDNDDSSSKNKRKTYAIVSETLRFQPVLETLLLKAGARDALFSENLVRNDSIVWVMLYDLLLGKGSIQGGGQLKKHIVQYEQALRESLQVLRQEKGLSADDPNQSLLADNAKLRHFPRYARVNLLKTTVEESVKVLEEEGFAVQRDATVPSLLVLPAGTPLHRHELVKSGCLILQDKSSCFSAEALLSETEGEAKTCLSELSDGDVIDSCAAPGNKTTHAAALLHSRGTSKKRPRVFAMDRDKRRLDILKGRVKEAGATGVITPILADFLDTDVTDPRFSEVRAILCDPSCSGSGIVTSPDRIHDDEGDGDPDPNVDEGGKIETRVEKLAKFQLSILLKALSFPQAQRVVYSTCSVHQRENEMVVREALKAQLEVGGRGRFRLVPCLPNWARRGVSTEGLTEEEVACMVRTDPKLDETNGFFVALLQREEVGSAEVEARTPGKKRKKNIPGGEKKKRKKMRQREMLQSSQKQEHM